MLAQTAVVRAANDSANAGVGAIVDRFARKAVPVLAPGLAVAVVRDGRVEVARGYGVANLEREPPVTPDTRFEIGSITKQFTAACVLQLARAGRLSLDDPLRKYVPTYGVARDVTLRELLAQTSGIPEYLDGERAGTDAAHPESLDDILAPVTSRPLLFKPGTNWAYSNTNYVLLGAVIALVSGESYEAYVREHLFAPAGMSHSGFIGDGLDPDQTALGYVFRENTTEKRLLAPAPPLDASWLGAAGAIVSTVDDMAAWDVALGAGRILSPRDVAMLRTSATLSDGAATHYGFGTIVDDVEGHPRAWHNGGTFGFHTVNAVFPNDRLAVVVFANEAGAPVETIATGIFLKLTPDAAERRAGVQTEEDDAVTARVRDEIERLRNAQRFAAFGPLQRLVFVESRPRGTAIDYTYQAVFASTTLTFVTTIDANGKIAGYSFTPS